MKVNTRYMYMQHAYGYWCEAGLLLVMYYCSVIYM
jgi:hypothetical protein